MRHNSIYKHIHSLLGNIGFWILLLFVIRLIGITNPPLEKAHHWRQVTVNMVARNFLEVDADIRYPRVDMAGEKSGITGMEFPLLNYGIVGLSKLFGYQHWYGRLINLIMSSLGVYFFYLFIRLYRPSLAFHSALLLLVSFWFAYSRKIMPDTFAVSLVIMGLYFGLWFVKKGTHWSMLMASFLFLALGGLAKIPSIFLFVLVLLPFWKIEYRRRAWFLLAATIFTCIPICYWYFVWVPHLNETYGFSHFYMGTSFWQGFQELFLRFSDTAKRFYEDPLKFSGFFMVLVGWWTAFRQRDKTLIFTVFILAITFFVFMCKAGNNFPHHAYYCIPFVPVMCLLAANGLTVFPKKWVWVLLLGIGLENVLNQQHDFFIKEERLTLVNLEQELSTRIPDNALVFINSGDYPTPLYFAHRKGWVGKEDWLMNESYYQALKSAGLEYLILFKDNRNLAYPPHGTLLFGNDGYMVYQLND